MHDSNLFYYFKRDWSASAAELRNMCRTECFELKESFSNEVETHMVIWLTSKNEGTMKMNISVSWVGT